jgi:hypothetical protein
MMPTIAAKRPPPWIFNEPAPLLFLTLVGVEFGCVDVVAGITLVAAALLAGVADVVSDAVVDVISVVDEVPSSGNEEVAVGLLPEVVALAVMIPVPVAPLMVKPGEKL